MKVNVMGRNVAGEELASLSSFNFLARHDGSEGIDTCEHAEQIKLSSLKRSLKDEAFATLEAIYRAIDSACKISGIDVMTTSRAEKKPRRAQKRAN